MNERKNAVHAHPLSIVMFLSKFLYLLIIPLLRGFLSALTGGFLSWITGAWMDLAIVGLIILLAYQKWNCFNYYMSDNGLFYTIGIFIKSEIWIPFSDISTFSSAKPFWLRPFKVVRLRADTVAGDAHNADVSFYVNAAEAERLMAFFRPAPDLSDGIHAEYHPRILDVIFLSLFTSNSFFGIVFVSTFISQAGQIVGEELEDLLIYSFEELSRRVAFGLPPIAAGAALVLFGGWLVAFLLNLLQVKNLHTRRVGDKLSITGGIWVEKEYALYTRDIGFIDIRQSLLTRLFGLYSVFLNAVGFNKDRSDITAIVPFSHRENALRQLSRLFPDYQITPRQLKPNFGAIFKFIIEPFWPCVLIPIGAVAACWFLPNWMQVIRFAGFMLSLPAFWFMGVRVMDFLSSGVSRSGNCYTLRYSEWFYLHAVVFTADKIALVNIRQSILQRGDKKCDLVVSTRAEGRARHHIRNLDWDSTVAIFDAETLP